VQRGDGVDDAFLVDDMADRHVLAALLRDGDGALGRGAGQASRSGVPGVMKAAPGRCRPIISISIWLLLAVP
jgi:hypothetical protein